MINSRQGLVTAALLRGGHPFSRSYGVILPSSLERVISRPLVFSTNLPVSVYGTGILCFTVVRAFLGSMIAVQRIKVFVRIMSQLKDSFSSTSQHLETSTEIQYRLTSAFSVPRYQTQNSTGILTCFPSTTPFGLALGPDSPSMDEPSGGILRFSGHWILTNVFVTQADILTSASSTTTYMIASPYSRTLPYR